MIIALLPHCTQLSLSTKSKLVFLGDLAADQPQGYISVILLCYLIHPVSSSILEAGERVSACTWGSVHHGDPKAEDDSSENILESESVLFSVAFPSGSLERPRRAGGLRVEGVGVVGWGWLGRGWWVGLMGWGWVG